MEGGAENEEHAVRETNDMRTPYSMQIVVCLAAGLVLAGCVAKTARPEGLVTASQEDFGQTLGLWGVSTGPYLVLPLLGPTTVRDGIGKGVDSAMNPLTYFVPFVGQVGMKVGDTVNDRALNYDLFAGVEATTIDLYSSVRHFYLKRREHMIEE